MVIAGIGSSTRLAKAADSLSNKRILTRTNSQQRQQCQGKHDNEKNITKRESVRMRDQAPTERHGVSEKLHNINIVTNVQNVGHMLKGEKKAQNPK